MLQRACRKPRLEHVLWLWLACAALSGCILEDPRASGVVVLDRDAVESGATLEQHAATHAASAVPLLVDTDAPVSVRNGSARQRLLVAPGELLQLRGASLEPRRLVLGRDADANSLALTAPRATAEDIAEQVSAELNELAPGVFELRVANAFVHLSQMTDSAADVIEVAPLELAAGTGGALTGAQAAPFGLRDLDSAAPAMIPAAPIALQAAVDPVGVYRCGDGALVLDAAGRFSGCIAGWGEQQGSYRISGRLLTLESRGGQRVLELDGDTRLIGAGDLRCALAGTGGAQ